MNSLLLPDLLEFHHIGYATACIADERKHFERLGYQQDGDPFEDPAQGVRGLFLAGAGPRLELLENVPDRQTLTPWLRWGVKMYHMGYLVSDLSRALEWARDIRAKTIVEPIPAIAFGGRLISFVMLRNGFLVEFIENGK